MAKGHVVLLIILVFEIVQAQDSCPDWKPEKCNKKKEILCIFPPKGGEMCPDAACIPKKFKNPSKGKKKCKGMCPLHCDGDHFTCERPVDENGCPTGQVCVPIKDPQCEDHFCPLDCQDNEMECPSGFMDDGCPLEPVCVPSLDAKGCMNQCPIFCPGDQVVCGGELDATGCPTPQFCQEAMMPNCPAVCPTKCGQDEMECPVKTDCGQCLMPSDCIPIKDTDGCPGFCPVQCPPWTVECSGPPDPKGCPTQAECMLPNVPVPGEVFCWTHCPIYCSDDQIQCPGPMDGNGCPTPDTCIPKMDQDTGCMNLCPLDCDTGFKSCPVSISATSGCIESLGCFPDMEECPDVGSTCPPGRQQCEIIYENETYDLCIAVNHPSTGCPVHCPTPCPLETDLSCQSPPDENGCLQPNICLPANDTNGCQNVCPLVCNEGFIQCTGVDTFDECPYSYCLPEKNAVTGCPNYCGMYPDCDYNGNNEVTCPAYDSDGCLMPFFCFPQFNNDTQCYESCPCNENMLTCITQEGGDGFCPFHECFPNTLPNQKDCPTRACPPTCEWPNAHRCETVSYDEDNCPVYSYTCQPYWNETTNCNIPCPSPCNEGQVLCNYGSPDDECYETNIYCTSVDPWMPEECPASLTCSSFNVCQNNTMPFGYYCRGVDSDGCPKTTCIGLEEIPTCPPCYDAETCEDGSNECPLYSYENDGEVCHFEKVCLQNIPALNHCTFDCPVACNYNETYCDLGTDENGCPKGGICVPYVGLDKCSVCPSISCGGESQVCSSVGPTTGCSMETCSLPLTSTCPPETLCQPDCPWDYIPCFSPSMNMDPNCPSEVKTCLPAWDEVTFCPNYCPLTCDSVTEDICPGFPMENMCPGPSFCVPKGEPCSI